jgi:hypothetical protein
MADYFTPTVVEPAIPIAAMTPLERLVLSRIFDSQERGGALYLFSDTGPRDLVEIPVDRLRAALARSAGTPSRLRDRAAQALAERSEPGAAEIDLSVIGWELIFQDIVRRSPELEYITVVSAFTCSKMRPDGFGGMATLITADATMAKSTHDVLEEFLAAMKPSAAPMPRAWPSAPHALSNRQTPPDEAPAARRRAIIGAAHITKDKVMNKRHTARVTGSRVSPARTQPARTGGALATIPICRTENAYTYSRAHCHRKGWILANDGNPRSLYLTIQRVDEAETFADDQEAAFHVLCAATFDPGPEGSACRNALRKLIEFGERGLNPIATMLAGRRS